MAARAGAAVTPPTFFATARDFRDWLAAQGATAPELLVGFRKVGSGFPSLTWPESVAEALCFGWIDGVRRRLDDTAYTIRFTPRRAGSIWSSVNLALAERLTAEGRMTPAGVAAYQGRLAHRSSVYAYEQATVDAFSAGELGLFQGQPAAWAFFAATPPGYQCTLRHWVVSAKKPETRAARLARLVHASAAGQRLR